MFDATGAAGIGSIIAKVAIRVLLHPLNDSAKNVVVDVIEGVVNAVPVASGVPPDAVEYHLTVVAEFAVSVNVPGPHRESAVVTGTAGSGLMVAFTAIREL